MEDTLNIQSTGIAEQEAAFKLLEDSIYSALQTYSNVHRGSGYNSQVSTHLYEQARDIVLEYMGLKKSSYIVVFCSPRRAEIFTRSINPKNFRLLSSKDLGLAIGVRAIALRRKAIPKGEPIESGGGTTKLTARDWIIWADAPDRFEAGTPAIINVIAFAKALLIIQEYGSDIFKEKPSTTLSAKEILFDDELVNFEGPELLKELRTTLIGKKVTIPTMEGTSAFINFDNSASTPTFAAIWETFKTTLKQPEATQQQLQTQVKNICADFLGAPLDEYEVIFTTNTTEAINIAAESLSLSKDTDTEPVIVNTLLEHSSNDLPWRMVPNGELIRLSVDDEGFIDLTELKSLLQNYNEQKLHGKKRIKIVAVSGASNVLGTCNNLEEISEVVKTYGAQFLVDGAQLVAHKKVDLEKSNIDYFAFSAHKIYAPFGSGALVVKKGLLNFPLQDLDKIKSSGEENTGGIAALGKAFVLLDRIGMQTVFEEELELTKFALSEMGKIPHLKLVGIQNPDSKRISNRLGVISFGVREMLPKKIATELSQHKAIGIRTGCHCAHLIVKRIAGIGPGLEKFQRVIQTLFPKLRLPGVARVSFGIENTREEVEALVQVLRSLSDKTIKNTTPSTIPVTQVKKEFNQLVLDSSERVYGRP
ncbi:MAG: aminotransferase class V-fold PLP-dependent enzyme [Bacteroidetes bacterium]|nr:MAG: aminotransferase class V-fold PLP-dependent enzyme [Bacteroidota bacterium]